MVLRDKHEKGTIRRTWMGKKTTEESKTGEVGGDAGGGEEEDVERGIWNLRSEI